MPESSTKVLITGGTGFLGQHVARALLARGDSVWLMGRNFTAVQDLLAAGAHAIQVDLRDRQAAMEACEGMEAVCHAAALSAPWGPRSEFFAANVGGTAVIIEGCRQHKVNRLVYISSPSVVFNGLDQFALTETAPFPKRFVSVYSLTKKMGEDLVNAASDISSVILRPKAIFGEGDRALLPRLIAAARAGRLPQIGDGKNLVDLTYVGNVAQAVLLALEAPAAVGHTYHITNDEHIPLWETIRMILERLGLNNRLRRISLKTAYAAAGLMEMSAALAGREPLLTRYTVSILARTQTYDISAAKRDLGYIPAIRVKDAVERTLASL